MDEPQAWERWAREAGEGEEEGDEGKGEGKGEGKEEGEEGER